MKQSAIVKVALVDDHSLLRNGLAGMINSFDGYTVLMEANNGQQFINALNDQAIPELVLLDINMPEKDGFETALWLRDHYPDIKIMVLSMYDSEPSIIKMLCNGAKGYLLKDTHPREFKAALDTLMDKGFYHSDMVSGRLIHAINNLTDNSSKVSGLHPKLSSRETEFLKLACTEMTYKEMADQMNVSPRTIDGYRDALFEKLNVKTRVGLVLFAIRNRIVLI